MVNLIDSNFIFPVFKGLYNIILTDSKTKTKFNKSGKIVNFSIINSAVLI